MKNVKKPAAPLPGEEQAVRPAPSALRRLLGRIGLTVLVIAAVVFCFLFLLLGEPNDDAKYLQKVAEERITLPMSSLETRDDANPDVLAQAFGQPVLTLGQVLPLSRAVVYDTAFDGAYARRVTLTYAFDDGTELRAESIRPTAAVTLLRDADAKLDGSSLYSLAGITAARTTGDDTICLFAQSDTAVYAVVCPSAHEAELTNLLRYSQLVLADAQ